MPPEAAKAFDRIGNPHPSRGNRLPGGSSPPGRARPATDAYRRHGGASARHPPVHHPDAGTPPAKLSPAAGGGPATAPCPRHFSPGGPTPPKPPSSGKLLTIGSPSVEFSTIFRVRPCPHGSKRVNRFDAVGV